MNRVSRKAFLIEIKQEISSFVSVGVFRCPGSVQEATKGRDFNPTMRDEMRCPENKMDEVAEGGKMEGSRLPHLHQGNL